MNKVFALFAGLSFFVSMHGACAGELTIDENNFQEKYTEQVNVSGSIKAGAIAYLSDQSQIDALWIDIPESAYKKVCVSIVSVDGKYEAQFSQDIEGVGTGKTRVIIPTQYENIIKSYSSDDLAVRAQLKDDCRRAGRDIVASWSADFGDDMMFFLNSEAMNDVLRLKKKDGEVAQFRCVKNDAEHPIAYNKECVVPDYNDYDLGKVMISRKNFSSHLDSVSYIFGE